MDTDFQHQPVLLGETLETLGLKPGETIVDVTLGLAGHSLEFAKAIGESGLLIGIDADADNLKRSQQRLEGAPCQKQFHHSNFLDIPNLGLPEVDCIFADLGVSSPHLDDAARGFSFRSDAPLDLRYDQSAGMTAAQLITSLSEHDLEVVLRDYGEVPAPGKLAANLQAAAPKTTFTLRDACEAQYGYRTKNLLPQVFQALRIAVNHELDALDVLLDYGMSILKPGGRVAIMSYHSLEDRRVKQRFKELSTPEKDDYTGGVAVPADFALLTKKPITPTDEEIEANQRSRSAKLRVLQKIPTPTPTPTP